MGEYSIDIPGDTDDCFAPDDDILNGYTKWGVQDADDLIMLTGVSVSIVIKPVSS